MSPALIVVLPYLFLLVLDFVATRAYFKNNAGRW